MKYELRAREAKTRVWQIELNKHMDVCDYFLDGLDLREKGSRVLSVIGGRET